MSIRVLVVDDSVTVRRHLCDVLASDPAFEVVGEAEDGRQAIERCRALRPDLVTLDMALPIMSGLAATEYIMAHFPTPILIVSSSTNRGDLFKTYEALAAGAVEILEKPGGGPDDGTWESRFLSTAKLVSRIRVITHLRGRMPGGASPPSAAAAQQHIDAGTPGQRVIAIGASTGGPAAIPTVLRAIPRGVPCPILVVMHIGEPFARSFGEWLDGQSHHRAALAREGQPLASLAGRVVLAPPDHHLTVTAGSVRFSSAPPRHSCKPSVDTLFDSVAQSFGPGAAACLLTGMGRDGASGLLAIRRAGGFTIAQDEATSVVFGMPKEAIDLDAADRVLPVEEIGRALATAVGMP